VRGEALFPERGEGVGLEEVVIVGKLVAVARAHWFQLPAGPGHTFEVDLVLATRHLGARFALLES